MLKIAWSDIYRHPLPKGHRFPMEKYDLLPEQLLYEGTITEENLFTPAPLGEQYIVNTHDLAYWHKLTNAGLSKSEIRKTGFPYSQSLVEREITIMNGTVKAAEFALEFGAAFNVAGGTHHACTDHGEGFCIWNDAAIAARDEVLSVVSHDLGNPLSAVRVSARVVTRLLEAGDTEGAAQHLEGIRDSVSQMERLIKDLLEVRRIESGRLKLVRRPEAVTELVEEAVRALRPVAEERGVALCTHLAPGLPDTVRVDADRIRQVFSNLIGNALKFHREGGRVTVGAAPVEQGVAFSVLDTGPGMTAEELPRVFDRFWQAQQQGSHGIGLGLAIAKGMTEAHGGHIRADSHEGSGCRFTFTIPADTADDVARS